ncbi:MAG: hypothetical protein JXA07_07730 [Spirochaetes bacterium]|nr:hypothetical protein [Spirochaetota bacterium]
MPDIPVNEKTPRLMRIPLDVIDFDDRRFKISRDRVDDDLRSSIRSFGLLDPPVGIREGDRFRVLFGFNRLDVLRETGEEAVDMLVAPAVDAGLFCERALIKCFRNECGPIGRTRALAILKDLGVEKGRLMRIARIGMHVPEELATDDGLSAAVLGLPGPVKSYLDQRDIQFRTIRDLVRLPRAALDAISSWLAFAPLRVNIFRFIIDMLSDIQTRDGNVDFVDLIRPGDSDDRKQWEERLFEAVRIKRYPEYVSMKKRADEIAGYFAARGIQVDYPSFFEGDGLDLKVRLNKREDPESVRKKIGAPDLSKLKELLDLL